MRETRGKAVCFSGQMQCLIRLIAAVNPIDIATAQALLTTNFHAHQSADLLAIEAPALRQRVARLKTRLSEVMKDPGVLRSGEESKRVSFGADGNAYEWAAGETPVPGGEETGL